jgi:hypothetical protein
MPHAIQLELQLFASRGGQPVSLFLPGNVLLFESLDPHFFK